MRRPGSGIPALQGRHVGAWCADRFTQRLFRGPSSNDGLAAICLDGAGIVAPHAFHRPSPQRHRAREGVRHRRSIRRGWTNRGASRLHPHGDRRHRSDILRRHQRHFRHPLPIGTRRLRPERAAARGSAPERWGAGRLPGGRWRLADGGRQSTHRRHADPDRLVATLGYTYLDTRRRLAGDSTEGPLAFRPRHLLTLGADYTLGILGVGADFRFASRPARIELEGFVDPRRVPVKVLDLRAALKPRGWPVEGRALATNLLNLIYDLVPEKVPPFRTVTLTTGWTH